VEQFLEILLYFLDKPISSTSAAKEVLLAPEDGTAVVLEVTSAVVAAVQLTCEQHWATYRLVFSLPEAVEQEIQAVRMAVKVVTAVALLAQQVFRLLEILAAEAAHK
jgi:hypothetical protein